MALNFKKNIVVGVSVSPDLGLEVAQIDLQSKLILKYGCKQLAYDNARREIADMDIFRGELEDLLQQLQIPKGSEVFVNIPATAFSITDYPASLDEGQVQNAIEEDLASHPIFQNTEASISAVVLPNSTMQFNKIAYTAAQKVMLIEIALAVKELGYKLVGIDTSVNSTLNALIYNDRVNISANETWVLLIVESNCCRIIPMIGGVYADYFEERISIGEVLGDAENFSIVTGAVAPILKNLPSSRLYVVSKTNVINAKLLSENLTYNGQIIHHDANMYSSEPYLSISPDVDENIANTISLDVVGAAIARDFGNFSVAHFNLYNESLGDIYLLEQPPVLKLSSFKIVLSMTNMIKASIVFAVIILGLTFGALVPINTTLTTKQQQIDEINDKISSIQKYLDQYKHISANMFDESTEIQIGLTNNKNIYSYYTIVGTEIPQKLWLTGLSFGKYTTIEGQADNLESVWSFYRNIKDYNPQSDLKLQKLGLATSSKMQELAEEELFDTDSIITSMNAEFYEFKISNAPEVVKKAKKEEGFAGIPDLEPLE